VLRIRRFWPDYHPCFGHPVFLAALYKYGNRTAPFFTPPWINTSGDK
jgi:hypothetical protein